MANAIRRLSCIPEAISQAIKEEGLHVPRNERRPSLQELEDSALLFLERRKSSDSGIGNIQPDLYRKRGSIVNVTSKIKEGASAAKIQVQLDYDFQKSDFLVNLLEASLNIQLDECEFWFYLDGDQQRIESCKVIRGKAVHKETFKFPTAYEELLGKELIIELVSTQNSGSTIVKHGRCEVNLSALNPSDDLLIWIDLESIHEVENRGGEINIYLQYLPSAQRLTLSVHQANGLASYGVVPSAFVKASLTLDGKILKKRKTSVKKLTPCPIWNEVLTFEVDPRVVGKCRLELSIQDGNTGKNLGVLVLGENTGHGAKIWREALKGKPQKPRWLPLVSSPPSR
ncbi:hypothetical protein FO519_005345 [Halicephalobus sp. NKZ332]|nr:hypothetical protein FO519_005345 [Halicephalobus sp. NKZ332]